MPRLRLTNPFHFAVFFVVCGCATTKVAQVTLDKAASQPDEKWVALNEKIKEQEAEIERLHALIDVLESEPSQEAASPIAPPDLPVVKLKPESEKFPDRKEFTLSNTVVSDATVADSSHESMHFYYEGLTSLETSHFDEAQRAFTRFLQESPSHVYADRAEYLVAKSYFESKEFGLAVLATNQLESRYPYSFRAPDALYYRALSYVNLGHKARAEATFQDLLKKYPWHRLAESASQKLAELTKADSPAFSPPLMEEGTR